MGWWSTKKKSQVTPDKEKAIEGHKPKPVPSKRKRKASKHHDPHCCDCCFPKATKKGRHVERCPHFPCCCYIPLDIAMIGFALIDIIYYSTWAVLCAAILTLEPFSARDPNVARNPNTTAMLGGGEAALHYLKELEGTLGAKGRIANLHGTRYAIDEHDPENDHEAVDYLEQFHETSTTPGPILIDPYEYDYERMSRTYSRIAYRSIKHLQEIDDGCSREYYEAYLFGYELNKTRDLFEETMFDAITANILYAVFGALLLTTLCCFRGYVMSKTLVITLWYCQLIPSYLIMLSAIMSQSQRFCILQYGFEYGDKHIKGQTIWAILLLWPLLIYKPYELFIWSNYIRKYFQNRDGRLTDEGFFSPERVAQREIRNYTHRSSTHLTDLTKHHYNHYVGHKRLFRQQVKHRQSIGLDKRNTMSAVTWLRYSMFGGGTPNVQPEEQQYSNSSSSE